MMHPMANKGASGQMQKMGDKYAEKHAATPEETLIKHHAELLQHFAEEVNKAAKRMKLTYTFYITMSVVLNTSAIILNGLVMAVRHLGLPGITVTFCGMINLVVKGLEMKFRFDHILSGIQSSMRHAKMLDSELQQLYIKLTHNMLKPGEFLEFSLAFEREFECMAPYVANKTLTYQLPEVSQEDIRDAQLVRKRSSARLATNETDIKSIVAEVMEEEQHYPTFLTKRLLLHYDRTIQDAREKLGSQYLRISTVSAFLTASTLLLNPLIIAAQQAGPLRSKLAYFATVNTIVKGIELHWKVEHTQNELDQCMAEVTVLHNDLQQLLIMCKDNKINDAEMEAFKNDYAHVFKAVGQFIATIPE